MNKAEEQYQYRMGRCWAQAGLMLLADKLKDENNFIEQIKYLKNTKADTLREPIPYYEGYSDYNSEILRLIDGNVITDWPSFVTHMTGETYE